MPAYLPPAPPFVKARWFGPATNKPVKRIVIHGTVSPCGVGWARKIANYFATTGTKSSAHYIVDPGEVVQSVYDSNLAWHDGTNVNSLGVELCDPVEGPLSRWDDADHRLMLRRAARLVAELCLAYDVPPRFLSPLAVKAGRKGITTHNNMRLAFPGSTTHWDPGAWPRRRFMRLVRAEVEAIKAANAPAPVAPAGPTRVSRARDLIADGLDLLTAAGKKKPYVRKVATDLRHDFDRLPER